MLNGRPADNSVATYFESDGTKRNVESLQRETDVQGWLECISKIKNVKPHG